MASALVLALTAPAESMAPRFGGGLTALPPPTVGPSQVANGGFEAGTAAPWSAGSGWTVDRQTAHTGRFSYRRDAGAPTATTTLQLSPGTYRFSAWVKTKDLAGNVRLRFDLRPGTHHWSTTEIERGTADWRRYEVADLVVTRAAIVTLKLEAEDGAAGTAWFDDVMLEELLAPPLQTFLLYPNFRGIVFDDGPSTLTFDVEVNPRGRDVGGRTVRGILREEATGRVVTTTSHPAREGMVVQLDASAMRLGATYLASFALVDDVSGAEVYATLPYRVLRASPAERAAMNASFDRRNRIEVNGVPRFLLGGDDPRIARGTAARLAVEVVDACATTIGGAFARYEHARRGQSEGLMLAAAAPATDLRRWRDVADIVTTDAHALFGPEPATGYDHGAVARATALARVAVKDARPVIGILPFTQLSSLGRRPTLAEMRGHAYMAIVEGARGLWWSSLGDGGCRGDCREPTRHLDALTRVIDELTALEPVLLADDAPEALSGNSNSNIKTRVKRVNGKGFVLAYNASGSRQTATFTWSAVPGPVLVHAEDRALVASGRSFTDTFAPFAAHVYVVADDAAGAI